MYNDDEGKTVAFWGAMGPSTEKKEEKTEPEQVPEQPAEIETAAATPGIAEKAQTMSIRDAVKEAVKTTETATQAVVEEPVAEKTVVETETPTMQAENIAEEAPATQSTPLAQMSSVEAMADMQDDDTEVDLFSVVPRAAAPVSEPVSNNQAEDDDEDEGKTVAIWDLMRPSRKPAEQAAPSVNRAAASMSETPTVVEVSADHKASAEMFQKKIQANAMSEYRTAKVDEKAREEAQPYAVVATKQEKTEESPVLFGTVSNVETAGAEMGKKKKEGFFSRIFKKKKK
ncbi:MAG: hypothetical protein MJ105_01705 [Lachnospiraceae bacterium]|nr:hypothetical protein [Lachnospiraceae bacterium]